MKSSFADNVALVVFRLINLFAHSSQIGTIPYLFNFPVGSIEWLFPPLHEFGHVAQFLGKTVASYASLKHTTIFYNETTPYLKPVHVQQCAMEGLGTTLLRLAPCIRCSEENDCAMLLFSMFSFA